MALCFSGGAWAQDYYDVTPAFLLNSGFDSGYNYAVGDTGNVVADEINSLKYWNTSNARVGVLGTWQWGSAKTFNGFSVPAAGIDGEAGGGLVFSTAITSGINILQDSITLPAGSYQVVMAVYNASDVERMNNSSGWSPYTGQQERNVMFQKKAFAANAWSTDTISFTLDKTVRGRLRLGFNYRQEGHAVPVIDWIKILRDTPLGAADRALLDSTLRRHIAAAQQTLGDGTGTGAAELRANIAKAQAVLDNPASTFAQLNEARADLQDALDDYSWSTTAEVVTDPRYARGATMAFGRMSVGARPTQISEQGFVISTNPVPTIDDTKNSSTLTNSGTIYVFSNLQPSTLYYMRAYAISKKGNVAYGDIIHFYTIPKGTMSYTLRTDGDADARARIDAAMKVAVDLWNNLTSIKGVNFNVGHNPGTPTADCSYGGYIRVGSNTSYQATGTMLHEMLHGVGVGTTTFWYNNADMRTNVSRGYWLGDRATEVLRFWDNSDTEQLNGDNQHLWPYGINGAFEDTHTDVLYYGNSLICQALGEDGLPEYGWYGHGTPYWSFDNDANAKYYLKNESADHGLYTSFLVPDAKGNLVVREMSTQEAAANDSAAWKIAFDPVSCFYTFTNVATGQQGTYQLMRSRVDAIQGNPMRGYWLTHTSDPEALEANADGTVSMASFDISNGAKAQRWLLMTLPDVAGVDTVATKVFKADLSEVIEQLRKLEAVPHTEDVNGTDETLEQQIKSITTAADAATSPADVQQLIRQARQAMMDFLANATPTDNAQPFDLTLLIQNPGMDAADGWTGSANMQYSVGEFYQTTFNFYQTLKNMPAGTYQLKAEAFQRPGTTAMAYGNYTRGTDRVTTWLYAGDESVKVQNIIAGAQTEKLGKGTEVETGATPATYVPNDMQSAAAYFDKGIYENTVTTSLADDGADLTIGIRCASAMTSYWSIFDNFRLYYYGSQTPEQVTAISGVKAEQKATMDVYSLDGQLVRKNARTLNGLPHGIYIVNGKKVVK